MRPYTFYLTNSIRTMLERLAINDFCEFLYSMARDTLKAIFFKHESCEVSSLLRMHENSS